ncbi:MAG: hypothetical protein GY848_19745 [Methyloversatilis sp.]|nr:hypothetical protein [Methyloversatilis sp.]
MKTSVSSSATRQPAFDPAPPEGWEVVGCVSPLAEPLSAEVQAHIDWLIEGPIRLPDGMVAAWVDADGPTGAYAEATGYTLTLFCYLYRLTGERRYAAEARRTAIALAVSATGADSLGRRGVGYLFDSAIGLRALGALFQTFPDLLADPALADAVDLHRRLADSACDWIGQRLARRPQPDSGSRWSDAFNAHMIKAVGHAAPWCGETIAREAADSLIRERFADGLFATDPDGGSYLHAHCYGLEGLLLWPENPPRRAAWVVACGAAKLAELQTASGGLPRRLPTAPGESNDETAADATAQAVRVWQCVDADRYARNIARGLGFLRLLSDPGGGFGYAATSDHLNAWTTVFAVQALIWQNRKPEPVWIV